MSSPRLLPTQTWVRLAVVPALVFIALAIDRQYLLDFWHHLAHGRFIVEQGEFSTTIFSRTPSPANRFATSTG